MPNSAAAQTFALIPNPGNKKIVAGLENAGAQIIEFPPVVAEKIELDQSSHRILKNLQNYDWLIFTDVLAVEFFLDILKENEIDLFELDSIRVCALGEIVSDKLRFVQLHADVIPNTTATEDIFSALKNYIAEDEFTDLRFLLPTGSFIKSAIKKELLRMNAKVDELPVCRISIGANREITRLKTLLKGGAIDEFIFSAPTDFIALEYIFGGEPLERLLSEINVSAVDGSIHQTAREHNLKHAGLFQPDKIVKVDG